MKKRIVSKRTSLITEVITSIGSIRYRFIVGLTFSAILISTDSKGQCRTNQQPLDTSKKMYLVQASFEPIYRNTDLENGLLLYSLRAIATYKKGDPKLVASYFLECFYARTDDYSNGVVPRRIMITYTDGKTEYIDSDRESNYGDMPHGSARLFRYPLLNFEAINISTKQIKAIELYDRRTNQSFTISNLYQEILTEQMSCLQREIN